MNNNFSSNKNNFIRLSSTPTLLTSAASTISTTTSPTSPTTSLASKQHSIMEEKQKFIREQLHSRMNQRDLEWKQEMDQLRKQFFSDSSGVGLSGSGSSSGRFGSGSSSSNVGDVVVVSKYSNISGDKSVNCSSVSSVRENLSSPDSFGSSFSPPMSPDFQQQLQQQQQQSQHYRTNTKSPSTVSSDFYNFPNIRVIDSNLRSNVISPVNIISSSSLSPTSTLSPTSSKHEFEVKNFLPEEIKVYIDGGKLVVHASHKEQGLNKSVSREFKRTVDLQSDLDLDPSQLLCSLTQDGKLVVEIEKQGSISRKLNIEGVVPLKTTSYSTVGDNIAPSSFTDKYFNADSTFSSTRFRPIDNSSDKIFLKPQHCYQQPQQKLLQQYYCSNNTTPTTSEYSTTSSTFQFTEGGSMYGNNTNNDYFDDGSYTSGRKKTSLPDLIDNTNHNINKYSDNINNINHSNNNHYCNINNNNKYNNNANNDDKNNNNYNNYYNNGNSYCCQDDKTFKHDINNNNIDPFISNNNNIDPFISNNNNTNQHNQTTHTMLENDRVYQLPSTSNFDNFIDVLKITNNPNTPTDPGITVIRSTSRPFHVGLNVGPNVDPNDLKIDAVDKILLIRILNGFCDGPKHSNRMWKIYLPENLDPTDVNAHLTEEGMLLLEESVLIS